MDELISRQAAIDILYDFAGCIVDTPNGDYHKAYQAYRHKLETLPSAQPDLSGYSDRLWRAAYERGKAEAEQRWIPVTEGLPGKHRSAIVTDFGHVTIAYTNNLGEWMDYDGNRLKNVTAWQPLPTAYERSEDGSQN